MSFELLRNITLSAGSDIDRQRIYQIRHEVYAEELNQHAINNTGELRDDLDLQNHYIVARDATTIFGFISITSPASPRFSVDKYFARTLIPYDFNEFLYEVRLLTIVATQRKTTLALALMYAAYRWIQSHGGKYIVAICRSDILNMYLKAGLEPLHVQAASGKVTYDLCTAAIENLEKKTTANLHLYESLRARINWQLPFDYYAPPSCYHGGSFFHAIGEELLDLSKVNEVINADVLDAWFPPSPKVIKLLSNNLSWLLKTSPPTHAGGLIKVISEVRVVREACLLPGAGSSNLIFLGLTRMLNKDSKVLLLDPCYGEYIHVLEQVIGCQVTRFTLSRKQGFAVDTSALLTEIQNEYNMVILVNPNSPTGVYTPQEDMKQLLRGIPRSTLVWIDETYIEYTAPNQSLEQFASKTENVIVCKSMSKVYALSGARVAYLCCSPHLIERLKVLTPPWSISLPAQAAAIMALNDEEYYTEQYEQTHRLRESLKSRLPGIGIDEVIEGIANFLLFYLPAHINTKKFIALCKVQGLFLRDVSNMGNSLGANAVRIAVKDEETNDRMVGIMKDAILTLTARKDE